MTTLLEKMQSTYYIAFKAMYDDVVTGNKSVKSRSHATHMYVRTYVRRYIAVASQCLVTIVLHSAINHSTTVLEGRVSHDST